MKIYTKTGDNGSSGLIGGTRVAKDDIRLDAYGNIDELNSYIGLLLTETLDARDRDFLQNAQHLMFKLGSYLATDQSVTNKPIPEPVSTEKLEAIEQEIDSLTANLPEIKHFILPGGNRTAALCHICRTVCRRSERKVVKVSETYTVAPCLLRYLNRLSDYFFTLSRKYCLKDGPELFWDTSK